MKSRSLRDKWECHRSSNPPGPPDPGLGVLCRTVFQYLEVLCLARPLRLVLLRLACGGSGSPAVPEMELDPDAAGEFDASAFMHCHSPPIKEPDLLLGGDSD